MEPFEKHYEWDDEVPDHAPDLYDFAGLAETHDGLDSIGAEALARYHEQGFLAINNAFTPEEVEASINGLIDLIAERNPDFSIIQFHSSVRDRLPLLTLAERLDNVRQIGQFTEYDQRLHDIAFHPKLLRVVETILGAKAELYQSMALIKPPRGREKPWHQDHAYFDLTLETKVVGVWIALDEATVENGCMRVLPGRKMHGVQPHFMIRDWQLCDVQSQDFKAQALAVPLKPGGCMIFDSFIPHGTPSNHTQLRRKALQYHYHASGTSRTPKEARLEIWGSEGKDVRC
jgi:phytanoyl-CoA hydroxylase